MTSKKRYTVLLIEDSPEDRATYARYLQRDPLHTYDILEANSAAVGLEICQNSPPDIIFLDYVLPDMDGIELLKLLAQQDRNRSIPTVMLTGQGNEMIAAQAIKSGAQDYVIKDSLTADLLCKTVSHAIEQFQSRQALKRQEQQQQIVAEITLHIRQSLALQDILQTTVDEVRQFLQVDRVIIFRFLPNWHGVVAVESCGEEWTAILSTEIYDPCFGENYIEPFREGLFTAKSDIYNAGIDQCHLELLSNFQVRANLVVPIIQSNQLWGLLIAHHCVAPRQWQNSEIDLLQQIAAQVSIALQQAALFEHLQTELADRKQAEESLRQSEARLRLAQTTSNSAVWDWDVQKNTLFWSPEYYKLYRLDLNLEPNFENWLACIHPDDREKTKQQTLRLLEDEASELRVEFRVLQANEIRWLAGIGQVMRDKAGQPIRMIGITIDITQQKQVEIELQQLNADLEQRVIERTNELKIVNDRLLETVEKQQHTQLLLLEQVQLLDLAHDTIMTRDLNSVITFWNQGAERTYGWTKDEALGKDSHTLLRTQFPQPLTEIQAILREQSYWEGELLHFSRDNLPIIVASRWVMQKDPMGRPIKILEINNDITANKQAEKTLALQAVITRSMAEGICLVKEDATIVYANPKFEQMFGYDPGELNGQNVSILNYDTSAITAEVAAQSIISTVLQSQEATYEVYNVKKDGTPFWCRATCSVFNHPDYGNVLVAVQQDITHAKQAEAALQQQARLEALRWEITQAIRQSLDIKAILNTTTKQTRQTLQVDRVAVYRFQPDWSGDFIAESVGDAWVKLVDSDVQKTWKDTYLQETQGGRFQNHETFVISDIYTAGLQPCHIELLEQFQAKAYAVAPIFVRESLWGLLAIYQNVTTRTWQEWEIELMEEIASQLAIALQQSHLYNQLQTELQERKRAIAIIQETERRWRSLLDNVQLIVVGLDQTGNINYVNPFFLSLTGYTSPEVLGKNWFEKFLPSSNQPTIQNVFSEVLAHNAHPYYQNSILTKLGEERFVAWNNTMLQDIDGNVIGTISIGEDITERRKIDQMKQEFISVVSHELRTPLTSIRGSLGLLAGGVYDKKPEKMKEMITIAARQSDRLVRLVNDILNLRRLESGQSKFKFQQCPAADLIQQSVDVMRSQAEQSQITLSVISTTVTVWADADAIVQTLTNLLSNAIKFSPPNATVTITATPDHSTSVSSFTLFSVQDQGRGIPANHLETIFGQFQQVDASDSREKGGTGLGLAICRTIIKQHGGRIWVESVLEQGSTFYFTLPSTPPSPDND